MKKSLLAISVILSTMSFANSYVIVVDKETVYDIKEIYTEEVERTAWVDEGSLINCSYSPLNTDYYKGVSFQQTATCDQKQVRDVNTYKVNQSTGEKTLISTEEESQFVQEQSSSQSTGTYLANSCSDIVDHHGKNGDKIYETTKGSIFCDMDYKDGSGYQRTHLYKPDQTLMGGCTYWGNKKAEFCSNYTDTLGFNLNKTSNAYMEFVTYNYSGTPANSNTSIITVDNVNVTYNLTSTKKHEVDLSSKSNGAKNMIIRFSHDATSPGKDNNMGVREIFLYEK